MKKIFGIILIAIYSLLFFIVLTIFSENDRSNVYSDFGFREQYDVASLYFEEPLQENDKIAIIEKVDRIAEEHDIAITVSNFMSENDAIIGRQVYVAAKDKLVSEMLPKQIQLDEKFSQGNQYISNKAEEDENKINLFTFYKGFTYELIPFHFLEDHLNSLKYELTFFFNEQDRQSAERLIENEFADYSTSLGEPGADFYNRNEALEASIQYISVIAFIIFVLFILFTISYNIKDIAILKLNGFKVKDILVDVFKSDVLYSVLFSLLIPIILSALVFQTYSPRLLEFNGVNIMVGFLLVGIFIVLIVLSTLVISHYRLSDFIKNKNINGMLTKLTYGLLILATFVILPMIQEPMSNLFKTVQNYVDVKMNEKYIDHIHEIRFNEEDRNWEFDLYAYLKNEPNEQNEKQMTIYDDLAKMDAIYHFKPTVLSPQSADFEEAEEHLYAAYYVNGKYVDESNFTVNGERIEVEDSSRLNIFMDAQTFSSYDWRKNDFAGSEVEETIYIFDSSDYFKLEDTQIEGYNNIDAPIFLYSENESLFVKSLSNGGFYIDGRKLSEINQYRTSENLENEIEFYKINDRSSQYTDGLLYTLQQTSLEILPGFISLLAVFVSFTNFHSLEKNREIKILKSLGYKTLSIAQKYIRAVVILNIIFIGYSLMTTDIVDGRLFFFLFILSILMVFQYVRKINQAQINKI